MRAGGNWVVRLAAPWALAVATLAMVAGNAAADQRTCRKLEAQLSAADGGGGSQFKKYDKAVEAQRAQLTKARSQARSAGCGFTLFGGGEERCSSINATIERMQGNLASLERKRGSLSGGGPSKAERNRIMAALDQNGCRGGRAAARERTAENASDGRSLFDQLFGGGVKQRETIEDRPRERVTLRPGTSGDFSGGAYRTLCVRTCDGYYFPMSGASSQSNFERDQKNCEAMCPGTEVKLYYHRAATEESEAMVSVSDGTPYTQMSTAFQYRDTNVARDQACGCNVARNFTVIAGEPPRTEEPVPVAAAEIIPQPVPRPDPSADPETLANAEGGLTEDAIRSMLKPPPAEEPKTASTGKIRVVGPVFLPDPAGAIDLRAPGQMKAQ